ncbi:DUF305 domain-containing protein [Blastococcus mobilis]|uniref:Uncharacterized conserved protein, DUF305 family n=1 Tax=Blastococcus mobilis TaxID=1938746 RepID=A0A238UVV2_9ACTN|nr:DUF305 domain-containing protein [Blastococcus mobilis]SNR25473.1 Uncharacterized conserved protein, DUF305 family [Blastococcus mobilis]
MIRTTARLTAARLAGSLVAGALVLGGCADDTSDAAGHASMTSSGGSSSDPSDSDDGAFNDADVRFAQGMLPHHESAIEMAQLADGRAADPRVLDLATRIEAAQAPEIDTLTGWLDQWGVEGDTGHGSTDHGDMGEMAEQDMQALMAASGPEFDRLFLRMMAEHHRGAIQMAETEVAQGQNADAIAMAESIRDSQAVEIADMERLLAELGG